MASTSAVSMATSLSQRRIAGYDAFFNPLKKSKAIVAVRPASNSNVRSLMVKASSSQMEKAVSGLTAAALTASMVIPEVAEAAGPGISPSLKNFLLSIAAGGIVLGAIVGVVIGVSNFDPVKRS